MKGNNYQIETLPHGPERRGRHGLGHVIAHFDRPLRGPPLLEEMNMTPITITGGIKQTVITRLATINSAIALLDLTNGKPTTVTIEDVLATAERIEHWAWRGFASDEVETPTPDTPHDPLPSVAPAAGPPPPAQANGTPPRTGDASRKQIAAIFAIGKKKGYSAEGVKAWVKRRLNKSVDDLTSREASHLIGDLEAL